IGVANLQYCEQLEHVNLMGSPTGDGAIRALVGKPKLRNFHTGRQVTDAGLPLLHQFPHFKTWHAYPPSADDANSLLIDGPFTNDGLATLRGLDGLAALDLFWHVTGITSDGFKVL